MLNSPSTKNLSRRSLHEHDFQYFRPIHNKVPLEQLQQDLARSKHQVLQQRTINQGLRGQLQALEKLSFERIQKLSQLDSILTNKFDPKLFKSTTFHQNLKKQKSQTQIKIGALESLLKFKKHSLKLKFKNEEDMIKQKLSTHCHFALKRTKKVEEEIAVLLEDLDFGLREESCFEDIKKLLTVQSKTRASTKIYAANSHSIRLLTIFNDELKKRFKRGQDKYNQLIENKQIMEKLISMKKREYQMLLKKKDDKTRDEQLEQVKQRYHTLVEKEVEQNKKQVETQKSLKFIKSFNEKLLQALNERKQKDQTIKQNLREQLSRWNSKLEQLNDKYKTFLVEPESEPSSPHKNIPTKEAESQFQYRLKRKQVIKREHLSGIATALRAEMLKHGVPERQFFSAIVQDGTEASAINGRLGRHPFYLNDSSNRQKLSQFLVEDILGGEDDTTKGEQESAVISIFKHLLH